MAWSGTNPKTARSVQLRGHSRERAWQHKLLHGSRRAPPAPCYPSKQCPSVHCLAGICLPLRRQTERWETCPKKKQSKSPPSIPSTQWQYVGGGAWEVGLLMFPIQHEIQKGFLAGLKAQVRGGDPSDCYQGIFWEAPPIRQGSLRRWRNSHSLHKQNGHSAEADWAC